MKTFLIYDEFSVEDHEGEEYDEILEVEQAPTAGNIQEWANRVRCRIRRAWVASQKEELAEEQGVRIFFDSSAVYKAMLINLQILMKKEEDIVIDLADIDIAIRQDF